MRLLTLCGSTRPDSSNQRLLQSLVDLGVENQVILSGQNLATLPLFEPDMSAPALVRDFRITVKEVDGVIISTPAYIENIPAALKSALEWLVDSGELYDKPVLAITFTPHPPRGAQAMQSLLWSLQALHARVVAQLPLYASEQKEENGKLILSEETEVLLREALKLF